jgi:hypothetical protein
VSFYGSFFPLDGTIFPTLAPMIDAIIDSTHPPQMGIHIVVFQKLGSTKAEIISKALQINGTYQILLGFRLTMKKQPMAIIKSLMTFDIVSVWVCGVIIASEAK